MWPFNIGSKRNRQLMKERDVRAAIQGETSHFLTKEDMEKVLLEQRIRRHRSTLWHGLSRRQKLQVLRYAAAKRRREE